LHSPLFRVALVEPALFGRIIHLYSSIDFALRYTAEVMDRSGMLPAPWMGKTAKLNMYNTWLNDLGTGLGQG
jgi:hypothetical protein